MLHGIQKTDGSERCSAIAVHKDIVHLSGQVSDLESAGIEEQTRDVFAKVEALLVQAKANPRTVLCVQVRLSDMDDYDGFNAVWDEWVSGATPPICACVEARLAKPQHKIEVLVVAVRDRPEAIEKTSVAHQLSRVPEHLI